MVKTENQIIERNYEEWRQLPTLVPEFAGQAFKIAEILSKTSFGCGFKTREDMFIAIMLGKELGINAIQSLQSIAVINGKPAVWGDALIAICQSHPDYQGIEEKWENNTAYCTAKRKGMPDITEEFSIEDAKTAGLFGKQGPWKQYPRRMCKMRARSWALRAQFADALRGLSSAEEVESAPAMKVYNESVNSAPVDPIFAKVVEAQEEPKENQESRQVEVSREPAQPEESESPPVEAPTLTKQQQSRMKKVENILKAYNLPEEVSTEAVTFFISKHGEIKDWPSQTIHDFEDNIKGLVHDVGQAEELPL